jgi:hypothetical protein
MKFNYNEYIFHHQYDVIIPRFQSTKLSGGPVYSCGFGKSHIRIVTICLHTVWLTLLMHFLLVACQAYCRKPLHIP